MYCLTCSFIGDVPWLVLCSHFKSFFFFFSSWVSTCLFVFLFIWSYFCSTSEAASLVKDKQVEQLLESSSSTRNQVLFFSDEFSLFSWQLYYCLQQQLFTNLMWQNFPASSLVHLFQEAATVSNIKGKVLYPYFFKALRRGCQWVRKSWYVNLWERK